MAEPDAEALRAAAALCERCGIASPPALMVEAVAGMRSDAARHELVRTMTAAMIDRLRASETAEGALRLLLLDLIEAERESLWRERALRRTREEL